tara:strand:- start:80 stop:265 length:186 start_codon:yes stop_codon:yes gene_type:complete
MITQFKAKIITKSNYRNLNGEWLPIKQFLGTIVTCSFVNEDGIERTTTFNLSEIASIKPLN